MKKLFSKIRKKSPSPNRAPQAQGSPSLGATGGANLPEIGYEIREKDLPKLHKAAWSGDLAKVKQLVKKDPSALDKENRSALHLACVQGHAQIVQDLLEWNAKTNIGDNQKKTPLIKAVECSNEDCVRLLLEYRAEIDAKDCDGNASLHIAVKYGLTSIVKLLLKGGANINVKNKDDYTPLHMSAINKKDEITRILLAEKADVNARDSSGRTPLMHACYEGAITPVRLLLQFNADTMIKDSKGFSAEDIAMMTGQHACSQLINDYNNRLRRSTSGASSIATTPRSSLPPSATPTPRDSSGFGIPAGNADNDSDDETVSKISVPPKGEDSWADDTDTSYSIDHKKGKSEVPNLAKALKSLPDSDDGGGDFESRIPRPQGSPKQVVTKQDSNKSLQSHTSVEDNSWSEEIDIPAEPKKQTTPRVSFKRDEEISEIHEITGDEDDNTDEDTEDELGFVAKKPKLHQPPVKNVQKEEEEEFGYTPTGFDVTHTSGISAEKHRGPASTNREKAELMEELGISDTSEISDPDLSEDVPPPPALSTAPQKTIPQQPPPPPPRETEEESEWDTTVDNATPRVGILKNWKQHSLEEAQKNKSEKDVSQEDISEWDSDVEDALDPEKASHHESSSQWDSSAEVVTPRGNAVSDIHQRLDNNGQGQIEKIQEVSDDDNDQVDDHDQVDDIDQVEEIEELSEEEEIQLVEVEKLSLPPQRELNASVELTTNRSVESALSNTTTATQQTVIERKVVLQGLEGESDSEWDSEEEDHLPSDNGPSPPAVPLVTPPAGFKGDTPVSQTNSLSPPEGFKVSPPGGFKDGSPLSQISSNSPSDGYRAGTDGDSTTPTTVYHGDTPNSEIGLMVSPDSDMKVGTPRSQMDSEDVEEESISEWEVERQQEKERKRLEEEELQRKLEIAEELAFQEKLQEQERIEELQRLEFLRQQEEDELLRQRQWEEEEIRRHEQLQKEVEEERKREELLNELDDEDSSDEDDEKQVKSPTTPTSPSGPKAVKTVNSQSRSAAYQMDVSPREKTEYHHTDVSTRQKPGSQHKEVVEEVIQRVEKTGVHAAGNTSKRETTQRKGDDLERVEGGSNLDHSSQTTPTLSQIKSTPTSKPVITTKAAMSLQSDGNSIDDDDSLDLDIDRPSMGTYLHNLPTSYNYKTLDVPDDDVLSFTSTENGDSTLYQQNLPYGKDVLANMNLTDPNAVVKLQEHMRDQRKLLDQEKNHRLVLENKHKSLAKEKNELQKKIDNLTQMRSTLEQQKLDLEQRIRNLEYNLKEEEELRMNAETLLQKTKEQLTKKEDQYTKEIEAKQKAELHMRNIQMELRQANGSIKQLEEEKEEVHRQLQHERNARVLQEQLNEEQQKMQHHLHEEHVKSTTQKSDTENRLESVEEERKVAHGTVDKLRAELYAIKMELERQRTRFKDENAMLMTENEELQTKIDELKNDIKLNEEALAHATMQYNLQLSNCKTEINVLNSVLEKEKASREKLETELHSLRNRLHTNAVQLEKIEQTRNELERKLQQDREEWSRQIDTKEKEVSSLKENTTNLLQRLNGTELKLNSVENELHISNTTLLEKNNALQQAMKDSEFFKSAQESTDQNYHLEKEHNAKLQGKIEALQEKVTMIQHENLSLKQQVETAQRALTDRSGDDSHEKFTAMLASLKTDNEKTRITWEEKNATLSDTVGRLKEENRNIEGRRNNLEAELNRLNREYTDIIRKLSVAEASLEAAQKAKDNLEQERGQLKLDLNKMQQKYETAHEKSIESNARIAELIDRLERAEQNSVFSNQQLMNSSANMEAYSKSKGELEDSFQRLQVENAKLEAELKHEKQRAEMLHKDLQDSQKVRSSLEALCSNLKSTTAHLEDKLGEESFARNVITQEAEDNKDLWEKEVISRSKLGMRLAQYERQKQESLSAAEEEKRKNRKLQEQKVSLESKLQGEQDKNAQLQKEVTNLKAYLKVAKKRLKTVDKSDSRISTLNAEFDKERFAMEGTLTNVKRQNRIENGYVDRDELEQVKKELEARYRMELNRKLDEVNNYLDEQSRARDKLDNSRDESEIRMKDVNKTLKEENTELRIKYEQVLAQKESKEMEAKRFRDLYESEMQWRMRLSDQLLRTNEKSFSYKTTNERQRNRVLNNLGNVTFSGTLNGHLLDSSNLSNSDDLLGNRLRAELDRSIAKHLEAAPHDNIKPIVRANGDLGNSSFAKSSADYLDILKRKYCV